MRALLLSFLIAGLITGTGFAQAPEAKETPKENPAAVTPESQALRATRHSFMLVSTRAIALFRTADNIDARLQATGSTLHPNTSALRLRIEHHLDQAEADIDKGDLIHADEHIKSADELVNRLARRIGGE